jgi:L-ornithine Nalpha-acyltransferase
VTSMTTPTRASVGTIRSASGFTRRCGREKRKAPELRPVVDQCGIRRIAPSGISYGTLGSLDVRLCRRRADVRLAQALRYDVFYREMAAVPSALARHRGRDEDRYDAVCDHLLVFDTTPEAVASAPTVKRQAERVVGTYRVLRQDVAVRRGGFYTQGEYDIQPLIDANPQLRFMELGRSCVRAPYRTKRTVELLWHALWGYARQHKIDVMIGCASFAGVDPAAHAMALSFLHHYRLAGPEWRVRTHDQHYQTMNLMPKDRIDVKAAVKALPPLIKAYLRLGAVIGDGAYVDHQFGTIDVFICLPVSLIDPRYFAHFGAPDEAQIRKLAAAALVST